MTAFDVEGTSFTAIFEHQRGIDILSWRRVPFPIDAYHNFLRGERLIRD